VLNHAPQTATNPTVSVTLVTHLAEPAADLVLTNVPPALNLPTETTLLSYVSLLVPTINIWTEPPVNLVMLHALPALAAELMLVLLVLIATTVLLVLVILVITCPMDISSAKPTLKFMLVMPVVKLVLDGLLTNV